MYQYIFYLNAFAKLNQMACEQALRKIDRKFLKERDNNLGKKLIRLTQRCKFYSTDELKTLETDLLTFYAHCFTGNDIAKAQKIIKFDYSDQIRKKDLKIIYMTLGAICIVFALMVYVLVSDHSR